MAWMMLDPPAAMFKPSAESESKHMLINDQPYRFAVRVVSSNPALYSVEPPGEFYVSSFGVQEVKVKRKSGTGRLERLVFQFFAVVDTAVETAAQMWAAVPAMPQRPMIGEAHLPAIALDKGDVLPNTTPATPEQTQTMTLVDNL